MICYQIVAIIPRHYEIRYTQQRLCQRDKKTNNKKSLFLFYSNLTLGFLGSSLSSSPPARAAESMPPRACCRRRQRPAAIDMCCGWWLHFLHACALGI